MAVRNSKRSPRKRKNQSTNVLLFIVVILLMLVLVRGSSKDSDQVAEIAKPTYVAEFDTVKVPVPVNAVVPGTKLKHVQVNYVAYPKHQLPEGAIRDLGPFLEAAALTSLPASLPIFKENISLTAQASNPVVERIPPGMRAITLRVDATSAVEGWAGSGALVDVLLIETDQSTVVAEQVKILSAERSVSPVDGASAPDVPSTVTVLVTQEQALALNTAVLRGKIAFALRSSTDEQYWENRTFTAEELRGKRSDAPGIKGYVAIGKGGERKAFALTDGKWVPTDSTPAGYGLMAKADGARASLAR